MSASLPPLVSLSTSGLRVRVASSPHMILDLELMPREESLLKTADARGIPIELSLGSRRLDGDDFVVTSLFGAPDMLVATCAAAGVEARLSWKVAPPAAISMLVQVRSTADGPPRHAELRLPIMARLHPGNPTTVPSHDPGRGPVGRSGQPLIRSGQYPLPHSYWSESGGVAVLARGASDTIEPSRWHPVPAALPLLLRSEWLDACELVFIACEPGWLGAFEAARDLLRSGVDLSEYERDDLSWYRDQWLHHFTFLYGGEIFDHSKQRFHLDRLLDDGQRFGGYDSVLLWPGYPRIGVDERDQWAFLDDIPSGRQGLQALAEQAHARNTCVFLPYLPWDVLPDVRHGDSPRAAQELARAVLESGADGVFLDTMKSVHPRFRREIDRVRSGVVFCSEDQPGPGAIAVITGSWDQGEHNRAGEVDFLRFLFPEHPRFMINRHATGDHRERVTKRALFNGSGLVVWQDVFGEVLPYVESEVEHIRRTIGLLRRHGACFRGCSALPLVPVAQEDLVANAFIAADERAVITVFNAGDKAASGNLVDWSLASARGWAHAAEDGSLGKIYDAPCGTLAAGQVAVFRSAPWP